MLTFKQFLKESRTSVISVDDFIKWADSNAMKYMKGEHFLYRGGSGDHQKGVRIGDSTSDAHRPRESANTTNNYTLWFDNNPMFHGWPKRSRAWIATDDRDTAEGFGGAALLIIDDRAKVGVVGEADLWHVAVGIDDMTVENLNDFTQDIIDSHPKQYSSLVSIMKNYTVDELQSELDHGNSSHFLSTVIEYMEHHDLENLFDLWESAMTPDIFPRYEPGADISHSRSGGEVWIEGEVGFIPHVNRLSEEDAQKIITWAEKHPTLLDEIHVHWSGYHTDQWGDE